MVRTIIDSCRCSTRDENTDSRVVDLEEEALDRFRSHEEQMTDCREAHAHNRRQDEESKRSTSQEAQRILAEQVQSVGREMLEAIS